MLERNTTVKVIKLTELNDKSLPDLFLNNRRLNMQGTIDSPIYLNFNNLWFVKHQTSGLKNGISISRYGIYREEELEIISTARIVDDEIDLDTDVFSPTS
jgi:hypothetical protein